MSQRVIIIILGKITELFLCHFILRATWGPCEINCQSKEKLPIRIGQPCCFLVFFSFRTLIFVARRLNYKTAASYCTLLTRACGKMRILLKLWEEFHHICTHTTSSFVSLSSDFNRFKNLFAAYYCEITVLLNVSGLIIY